MSKAKARKITIAGLRKKALGLGKKKKVITQFVKNLKPKDPTQRNRDKRGRKRLRKLYA